MCLLPNAIYGFMFIHMYDIYISMLYVPSPLWDASASTSTNEQIHVMYGGTAY